MRILGVLLIMLASGYGGILIARGFWQHPKNLLELRAALQLLETEIDYTRTCLPEACQKIAKLSKPPVSNFFQTVFENLENGKDQPWNEASGLLLHNGFLQEDIELLKSLGNILGYSDAQDQLKHIDLIKKQLTSSISKAEKERDKNVKLWSYLGFCFGALIVILLF